MTQIFLGSPMYNLLQRQLIRELGCDRSSEALNRYSPLTEEQETNANESDALSFAAYYRYLFGATEQGIKPTDPHYFEIESIKNMVERGMVDRSGQALVVDQDLVREAVNHLMSVFEEKYTKEYIQEIQEKNAQEIPLVREEEFPSEVRAA